MHIISDLKAINNLNETFKNEKQFLLHSLVHKRSHRNDTLSAGCHDRRLINGLHDNGPLVVRSIGPAAAATAADDHDDDEDKRATNHGSLTHNRHAIPPSKET